jgi:hypothetical protein
VNHIGRIKLWCLCQDSYRRHLPRATIGSTDRAKDSPTETKAGLGPFRNIHTPQIVSV